MGGGGGSNIVAARDALQAAKTFLRSHYRTYTAIRVGKREPGGAGCRSSSGGGLPLHLKPPFRKRLTAIGRFGLIDDTRTSF